MSSELCGVVQEDNSGQRVFRSALQIKQPLFGIILSLLGFCQRLKIKLLIETVYSHQLHYYSFFRHKDSYILKCNSCLCYRFVSVSKSQ